VLCGVVSQSAIDPASGEMVPMLHERHSAMRAARDRACAARGRIRDESSSQLEAKRVSIAGPASNRE
jgi:hypothetical protein